MDLRETSNIADLMLSAGFLLVYKSVTPALSLFMYSFLAYLVSESILLCTTLSSKFELEKGGIETKQSHQGFQSSLVI